MSEVWCIAAANVFERIREWVIHFMLCFIGRELWIAFDFKFTKRAWAMSDTLGAYLSAILGKIETAFYDNEPPSTRLGWGELMHSHGFTWRMGLQYTR